MNEDEITSLRSRRQGVDRGLWWGQGGVPASLPPRRFHLIGVGLPKTGTTSLANLFQRFRWGYEFLFPESVERLVAWKEGGLDRDEVERSVVQRSLEDEGFRRRLLEDPEGDHGSGDGATAARGHRGEGGRRERRHHLPGASQRLRGRRIWRALGPGT